MADNTVTGAVTSSIRPQARPTAVSGIGAKTPARQEEKAEMSFMDRITNLFTGFGGKDPKEKPASVNTYNAKLSVYQDMEDEALRSAELHRQDREGMGIARSLTSEQWAQRYSKEKGVTPNTTPPFWHQKQEHPEALTVIPVAETPVSTQSRGAGLMSPPAAGQLPAVDTTGADNWLDLAIKRLKQLEGFRGTAYRATRGEKNLTIGYGHYSSNITRGQTITQAEAEQLLLQDVNERLPALRKAIPAFDTLSAPLKVELLQGWFRGDVSGSPKTLALINAGDFEGASIEFLNNKEYINAAARGRTGIRPRMRAISEALRNEASR